MLFEMCISETRERRTHDCYLYFYLMITSIIDIVFFDNVFFVLIARAAAEDAIIT